MQEYSWSGHCKLRHTKDPDLGLAGTGLCPHGHNWTIVRGRVGHASFRSRSRGPIWLGWVTSGQGRGPAGWISGSLWGNRAVRGVSSGPEPVVLDWALCWMAPEVASWVWDIPGACLRQLVSHHEMIQNREFGAKELKWEGEF